MLTLVIQAGGESRRMGQDKALMPFLGQPLISRVIARLSPFVDEVAVTTNQPENYRFLSLPLFKDLRPGRGALGGLYTALNAASHESVAVVACDMPFASPQLLMHANNLLRQHDYDVVIPSTTDGYEPFHAVYRRETCIPAIKKALDDDKWKLISWFPQVKVHALSPDEIARFDPAGLAFWNLNTPEDFGEAEKRARLADD